jgi:hypothetical protein
MSDHNDVVARISQAYVERGFRVQTKGNNLPQGSHRDEAIYRPDLLVRDRTDGQILLIVEVETSDAGKSVVGAAVLADVCMGIEIEGERQRKSPSLLFVFYRPSAHLDLAKKRLAQLRQQNRINHLAEIHVMTENDALEHPTTPS